MRDVKARFIALVVAGLLMIPACRRSEREEAEPKRPRTVPEAFEMQAIENEKRYKERKERLKNLPPEERERYERENELPP